MAYRESKAIEQRNFKRLKQKVAAWKKTGIIEQIAAKIEEELAKLG